MSTRSFGGEGARLSYGSYLHLPERQEQQERRGSFLRRGLALRYVPELWGLGSDL